MQETISFSNWVKQRRHTLDLTQKELARQIGCAPSTIEKIEQGVLRPSRQIAALLAERLEVPPDERPAFVQWARTALLRATPTSDTAAAPTHNAAFPILQPPLIGREHDLAHLRALLWRADTRLVTLTGPPGTGKTRLALQIGADLAADFTDGAVFVPLAPILRPDLVAATTATALGVRSVPGEPLPATLVTHLRNRQMLLVLDNFEQVLPAAPRVREWLEAAPRLKVLVTSRALLHLQGEQEYSVSPLELPDLKLLPPLGALAQVPAVALFLDRVRDVRPDFTLTPENAPIVAAICVRLEGLPLALELAASRVQMLALPQLLARLEQRLPLLSRRAGAAPAHQRTLRAAISWSYALLDPPVQRLFRRLGVFVGGCTVEAAEAVCAGVGEPTLDVLDGLATLVDNSLLRPIGSTDAEAVRAPRFSMLETIREYALEQLADSGEADRLHRQHAAFFLSLAEEAELHSRKPDTDVWLDRLEAEHDNLRAALTWGVEGREAETALRLATALRDLWYVRGYVSEGRRWFDLALALGSDVQPTVRAAALHRAAVLAHVHFDLDAARSLYEEALHLCRTLNDKQAIARALGNLGMVLNDQGDDTTARSLYEESLALARETDEKHAVIVMLNQLGIMARARGDHTSACAYAGEAVQLARDYSSPSTLAACLCTLGSVMDDQEDYASASAVLIESLALAHGQGDKRIIPYVLEDLAALAGHVGQPSRAVQLFQAAQALRDETNMPLSSGSRDRVERLQAAARAQLDEAGWEATWTAGQSMSWEDAVAYALEDKPAS